MTKYTKIEWDKHQDVNYNEVYNNTETITKEYVDEFKKIINKLHDTYKKKNSDYGNSFDKTLDFWGLQAAGIRMSDKLQRFNNIVKNGSFKVKDESIIDTLEDLATYAIMTVMYLNK